MLYIYDSVLEEIKKDIGDQLPERGGALLGEVGKPIITKFIYDRTAETTISSYSPSKMINSLVRMAEREEDLEFKGIIHSHPGTYDQPSSQDEKEIETSLSINSHIEFFIAPIVTKNRSLFLQDHEVNLGDSKASFYAGYRQEHRGKSKTKLKSTSLLWAVEMKQSPSVLIKEIPVTIIPMSKFKKDIQTICEHTIGVINPQTYLIDNDGQPMIAGNIEIEGKCDLTILVDCDYPNSIPQILISYKDGKQDERKPKWQKYKGSEKQLEAFVQSIMDEKSDRQQKKQKETSTTKKNMHPKIYRIPSRKQIMPRNPYNQPHPRVKSTFPIRNQRLLHIQNGIQQINKNNKED